MEKKKIVDAVKTAMKYFKDEDTWLEIAQNCMYEEFGWDDNAKAYDKIYRDLLKK